MHLSYNQTLVIVSLFCLAILLAALGHRALRQPVPGVDIPKIVPVSLWPGTEQVRLV